MPISWRSLTASDESSSGRAWKLQDTHTLAHSEHFPGSVESRVLTAGKDSWHIYVRLGTCSSLQIGSASQAALGFRIPAQGCVVGCRGSGSSLSCWFSATAKDSASAAKGLPATPRWQCCTGIGLSWCSGFGLCCQLPFCTAAERLSDWTIERLDGWALERLRVCHRSRRVLTRCPWPVSASVSVSPCVSLRVCACACG